MGGGGLVQVRWWFWVFEVRVMAAPREGLDKSAQNYYKLVPLPVAGYVR